MRVLVTGSEGHIGRVQVQRLLESGYEVRTTDRAAQKKGSPWEHRPGDLRDINFIRAAVQGVDAVVHLGAIASDRRGSGDEVLAVNVQGTWNVLLACVEAGVERVVSFSSINSLGAVGGHCAPVYLPLDDAYPRHPMTPYQLSKHLGEEACLSFTRKHGLRTICLRPGYVAAPDHYKWFREGDVETRAERQKDELWAYVDRRDVCEAALLALKAEDISRDAFLLLADDTSIENIPTAELIDRFYPDVPWKGDRAAYFADNPYRVPIDCSRAKEALGWQPRHSWRNEEETPA